MPSAPHSPRRVRLAWILAVAYLLTVVYASGQPFRGWHVPSDEALRFLAQPWPRYVTLHDVLLNIVAYVPLGFLLALALRPSRHPHGAALAAIGLAVAVSVTMEFMQTLLPGRIASNVDVLTNAIGAVVGALAAPVFAPSRELGHRLIALRYRWFEPGAQVDAGLVLAGLWILTALHPTAQWLGTGDLRHTLPLPALLLHTPSLGVAAEAAVATLNLAGLGLLLATLSSGRARLALLPAVLLASLALKASTAAGLKLASAWSWFTPGAAIGLVAGACLLYLCMRLPARTRPAAAAACIAAAVVVINLAPGNPYQTLPPQFLSGTTSHFLGYSGIVRALSEAWPLLAVLYLLARVAGTSTAAQQPAVANRL